MLLQPPFNFPGLRKLLGGERPDHATPISPSLPFFPQPLLSKTGVQRRVVLRGSELKLENLHGSTVSISCVCCELLILWPLSLREGQQSLSLRGTDAVPRQAPNFPAAVPGLGEQLTVIFLRGQVELSSYFH